MNVSSDILKILIVLYMEKIAKLGLVVINANVYLNVERIKMTLSRSKAMKMKCKRCMANFIDGRTDCKIVSCPLYPWMPYQNLEPDLIWVDEPFSHKITKKKVTTSDHNEKSSES